MNPKRIGIIGGLGAFAGLRLYQVVLEKSLQQVTPDQITDAIFPFVVLINTNFDASFTGIDITAPVLYQRVVELALQAKAHYQLDRIVVGCNTFYSNPQVVVEPLFEYSSLLSYIQDNVMQMTNGVGVDMILQSTEAQTHNQYHNLLCHNHTIVLPGSLQDRIVDEAIWQGMQGRNDKVLESIEAMATPNKHILLACTELCVPGVPNNCISTLDLMAEWVLQ